jgi:hypothetical protein
MAFRKGMFERYGGFRTDLWPSPNSQIHRPGEDTEFGHRLIAAGERLRYEPSVAVYHPVPQDRINKEYFLKGVELGRANIRTWEFVPAPSGSSGTSHCTRFEDNERTTERSSIGFWQLHWTCCLC